MKATAQYDSIQKPRVMFGVAGNFFGVLYTNFLHLILLS